MKRVYLALALVLVLVATAALPVAAAKPDGTGNGAPKGAHYNLNVIGAPADFVYDPVADPTLLEDTNVIYVPLQGRAEIGLTPGDFLVTDPDGTDGLAAFSLPTGGYTVWVRALGKPGGSSTTTPCYTDAQAATWCSTSTITVSRAKGKSFFKDVTDALLNVYADTDADGVVERIPLFSRDGRFFWDYENAGLKLAQFRFYPTS